MPGGGALLRLLALTNCPIADDSAGCAHPLHSVHAIEFQIARDLAHHCGVDHGLLFHECE